VGLRSYLDGHVRPTSAALQHAGLSEREESGSCNGNFMAVRIRILGIPGSNTRLKVHGVCALWLVGGGIAWHRHGQEACGREDLGSVHGALAISSA